VERYKAMLEYVLEDGKCTLVQHQILELFTRDVCARHLPIATPVWNVYTERMQPTSPGTGPSEMDAR